MPGVLVGEDLIQDGIEVIVAAAGGTAMVAPPASVTASSKPASSTPPAPSTSARPSVSSAPHSSSAAPSPSASSISTSLPPLSSSSALPSSSPPPPTPTSIVYSTSAVPSSSSAAIPTTNFPPSPISTGPIPSIGTDNSTAPIVSDMPASGGGFQLSTSTLVGIVVGGAAFLVLIGGCCWLLGRNRRRRNRAALEDDALGSGLDWRRSKRLSRAGWRRSLDAEPKPVRIMSPPPEPTPYMLSQHGPDITHGEARESVRMPYGAPRNDLFVPPRPYGAQSQRSSLWTDNSEADMYVNDSSSMARTLSTVTAPNSEYNLENDPGATLQSHGQPPGGYDSRDSFGTFGRSYAGSGYPPSQQYPTQGPYSSLGGSSTYMTSSTTSPISPMSTFSPGLPSVYETASRATAHVVQMPQQRQRIPAPRLLVDTKAPIAWEDPLSANTATSSAGPSVNWHQSSMSLLHNAASPAAQSPSDGLDHGRSVVSPAPGSYATSTRPLVAPRTAATDLPYSTSAPGPQPEDPAVRAAVANVATATPAQTSAPSSGMTRRPTIVRHADAGAFADAVPADEEELHLPPAYGDIYGPPASRQH